MPRRLTGGRFSIGGGDLKDKSGVLNSSEVYSLNNMTDILTWCRREGKTFGSLWRITRERIYGNFCREFGIP